ncbi:Dysbindin [Galemys pyrenaicus]|uniref:Dysbindin n=1 Tax=Galemys pyrenaicus TaxID=202257 RepID=A0A8J6DIQ3_GALPY|nr:Dysbindin [Galemys pyrenaicus]
MGARRPVSLLAQLVLFLAASDAERSIKAEKATEGSRTPLPICPDHDKPGQKYISCLNKGIDHIICDPHLIITVQDEGQVDASILSDETGVLVDSEVVMLSAHWEKKKTSLVELEEQLQQLPALIADLESMTANLRENKNDYISTRDWQLHPDSISVGSHRECTRAALASSDDHYVACRGGVRDTQCYSSSHLEASFEEVENHLLNLEDLCGQCELERYKHMQLQQMENYKKNKRKELETFKAELDAQHTQKVLEMEHTQQMKLKERQKFFEEAFQQDMEQYLSTGYLQIAERRGKLGAPPGL